MRLRKPGWGEAPSKLRVGCLTTVGGPSHKIRPQIHKKKEDHEVELTDRFAFGAASNIPLFIQPLV